MVLDITMVLFRPDWSALESTLRCLAGSRRDFRHLRVLYSGAPPDGRAHLAALARDCGVGDALRCEARGDNLGFAAGHNRLLGEGFADGADRVLVLNPDCFFAPGALADLMTRCSADPEPVALYGPTLALGDRDGTEQSSPAGSHLVDSLGIGWSWSGRHYDIGQGKSAAERSTIDVRGISGACLLVTVSTWRRLIEATDHFFDEMFVAYREDAELGVRAGVLGIPSVVLPVPGIVHARGTVGYRRGNPLVDALGARNRLLLRFTLGDHRPGAWGVPTLRDALVVLACLSVERSSLPAVRSALRVRRYMRYQRAALDLP